MQEALYTVTESEARSSAVSKPRLHETLLFVALLSGPPSLRTRDAFASLSGQADWSVLLNAAVWGLGAFWVSLNLAGYLLNRRSIPRFGTLHALALLFVGCLYLSTFASVAPILTFYRVSQIVIAILFGFFWVRRYGVESTLKHLLLGYVVLAVAIGVAAIFAPHLVYTENRAGFTDLRLRGDLIANTGSVAAIGLVLALGYPRAIKRRAVHAAVVVLFFALLVLALTRSAWAVLIVFALLAFVRLPSSKSVYYFLYSVLLLAPVALMLQWTAIIERWVVRDPESLSTMSERVPLWQYTLSESMETSPWIGVGFYANRYITTSYLGGIGTSHSSYIEVLSGGGIVSSVAFGAMLVVELLLAARLFLSHGKDPTVFTIVALLVGTLLLGVTSESMLVGSCTSFVFFVLLSLIPTVARAVRSRVQRGANGAGLDGSYGSQPLPATRR